MTGFAATHTGSLTPSSNPWTFVGTVTWQSDIDPAILPDNEPVVLRLAFTTLSLTGATIAFTTSGTGRAATLPANGPFDGSTDYTVASHKDRSVTPVRIRLAHRLTEVREHRPRLVKRPC